MVFSFFRSVLILTIMLVMIAAPACAITVTVGTRDGLESASASGEYRLQNSAFLDSDITLDQGEVSRRSSAGGTGKNMVNEEVSGSGSSITNTITSDVSFRSTSSDYASGAGAISSYQTSLAGWSGSIGTTSTGKENQMAVAGGFSGQGYMDVSLSSLATQEALTAGTASAVGTAYFSKLPCHISVPWDPLAWSGRGGDWCHRTRHRVIAATVITAILAAWMGL